MPKVHFLPTDQICEASVGESILDVALNHDVPLQHACGGFCSCTTCHVHVLEGQENLASMEEDEIERIEDVDDRAQSSRLGCCAKVMGDIKVQIMNLE